MDSTTKGAAYDVVEYTANSKPKEADHRLCILTFKTPAKEKNNPAYVKQKNLCVSIPSLKIKAIPDLLTSALQAAFEDLQDATIRNLIVNEDGQVIPSKKFLVDAEINFDAVAEYAAANAVSGKLTKEVIANWFDANLSEPLMVALANAMQIGDTPSAEDSAKLQKVLDQHKEMLKLCAATVPNVNQKIAKSLVSALNLVEEDRVHSALRNKLQKIANPQDVAFFGL